tara:strand:+ start:10530 stop:10715 length:186 start_codon:yes stop_codon:yes gene_type:complete
MLFQINTHKTSNIMAARKKLVDPVASATESSAKITSSTQEVKLDLNSPELVRKKRVDPADS